MIKKLAHLNRTLSRHEPLLLLLLLTIILRLPSLFEPFWYGDENIYLAIGQAMRHGRILYHTITDYPNKPPLIYLFAALVRYVSTFRLLLLFWNLINVFIIHNLAARFSHSKWIAALTTLLFIFLTSTPYLEGNVANAEIFFIMPTTFALLLLTSKPRHPKTLKSKLLLHHFLAGICLGFAFLFKIHVALDITALGLFFYLFDKKLSLQLPLQLLKARYIWIALLGLSLPILITMLLWAVQGVSPASLFFNATGSTGYVSVWNNSNFLLQTIGFDSLQSRALLLLVLTLILWFIRRHLHPQVTFIILWTTFTLFAALLSGRPYPHYLIQLTPPLVLGLAVIYRKSKPNLFAAVATTILVAAAIIRFDFSHYPIFSYYRNFISYATGQITQNQYYRQLDHRMPRNYALATYIRRITLPGDSIYIWGTEPGVYVLANRSPVEKLVTSFHVADLNYYHPTLQALTNTLPPVIVVIESEWRHFPGLHTFLADHYNLIQRISDPDLPATATSGQSALVYKLRLR